MEEACRDNLANMLSHAQLIVKNDAEISNILNGFHFNSSNIDTGICRSMELLKLRPGSKPNEFRLFWIKLESSFHAPGLNTQNTPFDVIPAGVDISHGRICKKLIVISICVVVDVPYRYYILNILRITDESDWSSHRSLRNTEEQPDACQPSNTTTMLNDIVTSMPTPHIRRAMKCAKFIQDNKIDINDRGELVHNHKVSENTNATDLINEAIRRKQMKTTGSKEFATLLNELNCPIELIGNPSYKKYMQSGNGIFRKSAQKGGGTKKSKKKPCMPGIYVYKKKSVNKMKSVNRTKLNEKCIKPRFKWCKY